MWALAGEARFLGRRPEASERDRHPDRAGEEAADWHEHDQVWLRWLCTLYNLRSFGDEPDKDDKEEDNVQCHDLAQDSADFSSVANPGHGEEIC